jgi:hypothetical protein
MQTINYIYIYIYIYINHQLHKIQFLYILAPSLHMTWTYFLSLEMVYKIHYISVAGFWALLPFPSFNGSQINKIEPLIQIFHSKSFELPTRT